MADIRINALATTATTPASDDYLALDGAAQGTRKILATNIANNVTDVILGTSGPSVKSTLSARAPRQGLVFDGTAGATVTNVPAFGTGDFTVAAWVNPTSLSNNNTIFASGVATAGPIFRILTSGAVSLINGDSTQTLSSSGVISAGKSSFVVYSRTGGTGAFYINGIASGSGPDSYNFSSSITEVGALAAIYERFKGYVSGLIYNRALSASEVVALYEAGAPAGADYNSASNTAINTSAWTNYLSTYTSFTGASATGFTAVKASGAAYAAISPTPTTAKGQKFRVTGTLTLNNGKTVLPTVYVDSGGTGAVLSAGAFSVTIEAATAGSTLIIVTTTGDADYTLSNLSVTRLGLLLAPDAAQAGGGLVWYDTSGNAANITLPASGVSWNVPFAGYVTAPTNTKLTLTGGSTGASVTLGSGSEGAVSSNRIVQITGLGSPIGGKGVEIGGDSSRGYIYAYNRDGSASLPLAVQHVGGNLLIGTTTDSSNGKLQLATHTTSAGGIGFGTDTSFFRNATGRITLGRNDSTNAAYFRFAYNTSTTAVESGSIGAQNTVVYIDSLESGGSIQLRTNGTTTALTLDSSQNATFAGKNVGIGGASNASVGLYVQSTLNSSTNYGITSAATFGTASNNIIGALYAKITTTAASFTVPSGIGLQIDTPTIGAASAITTNYGLKIENQTGGGTNYAIHTNGGYIRFGSLPTSSAGLPAGTVWNDAGTLKIA